jgi:succinyl-CoA synthetase beta subunit
LRYILRPKEQEELVKIHEYQAKQILADYGVPLPQGIASASPKEAEAAAATLGGTVVVKAQIHAGGRGQAGGVKLAKSPAEAATMAEQLLGNPLITVQTGSRGQRIDRVLVEQVHGIERELYLGLVLDRTAACLTIVASAKGGTDIEAVARTDPAAILRVPIHPLVGLMPYHGRRVGFELGLNKEQIVQLNAVASGMYRAFLELDASLIEINPLAVTTKGALLALDAKMTFDDNALFRHPEVEKLRDGSQEEPGEIEAIRHGLSYVRLDGTIGCMVNGAGLAMATLDLIKLCGGAPANFLDVGGRTDVAEVSAAFKIIMSDARVTTVLVNIFGGIVKCDVIAEGLIAAAREVNLQKVPLVVRLQGNNAERAHEILQSSTLQIVWVETMQAAAEAAVRAARGMA